MAGNLQHCIKILKDNEEIVKQNAHQVLLKICDNIIKFPNEGKYRKVFLANTIVINKLLPAAGAIECLFEAGFVESDDGFLLPANASLSGIEELHRLLLSSFRYDQPKPVSSPPTARSELNASKSSSACLQSIQSKDISFLDYMSHKHKHVLRYEDEKLQNKVKSIVPLESIQIAAMKKLREIQKEVKTKQIPDDNVVYEDMLLAELLSWFKSKFFKWVNSPACKNCMGECSYEKSVASANQSISRVEIHKCKNCGTENEFSRYTDPEHLLHTRRGRCGEWANCFTLICRSIGFDVRLVEDKTDHVWTEVWSPAHNRWIHADACENAMDRPLLYEKGWGKKLSYVIAFSRDEVQDVTWRYTRSNNEVMRRRKIVSEQDLCLFMDKLNRERQYSPNYSEARRRFVIKRRAIELAGMLCAPPGCKKPGESEDETNYEGRTSGSLAWRLARGETNETSFESSRWTIPREVKSYELVYSVVSDIYTVKDTEINKILMEKQKWQNGVETIKGGVFRKEEQDWQMVYLARSPGSTVGEVTWSFSIEDDAEVCVDSVKLQATTATFNGALLKWQIKGITGTKENESKILTVESVENFETKELKGASKIIISVILSGGEGNVAWQHAQLFRQSLNTNAPVPSLVVRIKLLNK